MGWKTVIGCGQNNNDTIALGTQAPSITGGSYDAPSGIVTLTLSSTPSPVIGSGTALNVSGVTGTGTDINSVNGAPLVSASGTSGTTVKYAIATGLTITAINAGGTLVYNGNNSSLPFTAYGPVGSSVPTYTWESPAPAGSYAIGQLYNNCPHTASGMTMTAGGSISAPLSANLVHQIVYGPTASPTQGNQMAVFLAGKTYFSGNTVSDLSHSDAIPGGGASGTYTPIALSQGWTGASPGLGSIVTTGAFWQADQPGGACVPFSTGIGSSQTGQLTYNGTSAKYIGLTGGTHLNPTITPCQCYTPVSGTWSLIHINMRSITGNGGGSANVRSNVNTTFGGTSTGNQNSVVTTTGLSAPDISHTDAVPAGSYITYQLTNNIVGNSNIGYSGISSTWKSSQPNAIPMMAVDVAFPGGAGTFWRSQVGYMVLRMGTTGGISPGASASEGPCNIPPAGTFSQMNLSVSTANAASTAQAYSLVGNVQGNQLITPFGQTTGVIADVSHSDAIAANTSFQYGFTNLDSSTFVASQVVAFTTPHDAGRLAMMGAG